MKRSGEYMAALAEAYALAHDAAVRGGLVTVKTGDRGIFVTLMLHNEECLTWNNGKWDFYQGGFATPRLSDCIDDLCRHRARKATQEAEAYRALLVEYGARDEPAEMHDCAICHGVGCESCHGTGRERR